MRFGNHLAVLLCALATLAITEPLAAETKLIFPTETYCGDGVVNSKDEECDDANNADGDGCSRDCKTETPKLIFPVETYCGDGAVNSKDEECDDANNADGDGCSRDCKAEGKPAAPTSPGSTLPDDRGTAPGRPAQEEAAENNFILAAESAGKGGSCGMIEPGRTMSPSALPSAATLLLAVGLGVLLRKRH